MKHQLLVEISTVILKSMVTSNSFLFALNNSIKSIISCECVRGYTWMVQHSVTEKKSVLRSNVGDLLGC